MMRALVAVVVATHLAAAPEPSKRTANGPTAIAWPRDADDVPNDEVEPPAAAPETPSAAAPPPPPQAARPAESRTVRVAVGLDPSAPGTKEERAALASLGSSVKASAELKVRARRLRVGAPSSRDVCREGRDDLVIAIGYVPQRSEAVLLPYDCTLDVPLSVRSLAAVDEPALVAALWAEHDALVRDGVEERRRTRRLGPKARAGIVAGVAIIVVGAAVGLLVANALRDETVVLTVGP